MRPDDIYRCLYSKEAIKIDGLLDESVWEQAEKLGFLVPVSLQKPLSKTEGRLLWDDEYLYVGFRAYDKDIWSYFTERDAPTCNEDVLEVFIKPHNDKDRYYNFEINALNTVYDAYNVKRGAGGEDHHRWSRWNCSGLKSAVKIKGTLNNHEDQDEYWQLEVAIPFAGLPSLEEKSPAAGDVWTFHLSRYDYSVYLPRGVEISSCAALSEEDFHRYEEWPQLEFVK